MTLKQSTRWELAGLFTALTILFYNPLSFRVLHWAFKWTGNPGVLATEDGLPNIVGFIVVTVVYFWVAYALLLLDWESS